MTQYVSLELKTQDPEFRTWIKNYPPSGNGIPMIFIVSADGKEIYNRSGAPSGDGLKDLLMLGINQTGGFKSISEADNRMAADLRKAKLMLGKDSIGPALKLLAKYAKEEEGASRTSQGLLASATTSTSTEKEAPKSRVEQAMDELIAELSKDGKEEIERATEFVSDGKALVGAVTLARAERIYGEWPPLSSQIKEARRTLQSGNSNAKLMDQAKLIDEARALEEKKMNRLAIGAYGKVVDKFPDSEAARLSKQRMLQLSPSRTWTDKTGKHKVQATLLRLNATHVKLRKTGGEVVTLARDALSEVDQKFLQTIE